jgi:hypothetical protein
MARGGFSVNQPGYFSPAPHKPGEKIQTDQMKPINLSPSTAAEDQIGARIGMGPNGEPT